MSTIISPLRLYFRTYSDRSGEKPLMFGNHNVGLVVAVPKHLQLHITHFKFVDGVLHKKCEKTVAGAPKELTLSQAVAKFGIHARLGDVAPDKVKKEFHYVKATDADRKRFEVSRTGLILWMQRQVQEYMDRLLKNEKRNVASYQRSISKIQGLLTNTEVRVTRIEKIKANVDEVEAMLGASAKLMMTPIEKTKKAKSTPAKKAAPKKKAATQVKPAAHEPGKKDD